MTSQKAKTNIFLTDIKKTLTILIILKKINYFLFILNYYIYICSKLKYMTNQKTKKGAPKRFIDAVHTAITIEKTTMTRIRKLVNHGNYTTMNDLINRAIITELSKTENQ